MLNAAHEDTSGGMRVLREDFIPPGHFRNIFQNCTYQRKMPDRNNRQLADNWTYKITRFSRAGVTSLGINCIGRRRFWRDLLYPYFNLIQNKSDPEVQGLNNPTLLKWIDTEPDLELYYRYTLYVCHQHIWSDQTESDTWKSITKRFLEMPKSVIVSYSACDLWYNII